MLPIVLLEITYKTIWLIVVGFPLLSAGTLDGRAEEMMFSFGLVVLPHRRHAVGICLPHLPPERRSRYWCGGGAQHGC
jgi:hypothetical protein